MKILNQEFTKLGKSKWENQKIGKYNILEIKQLESSIQGEKISKNIIFLNKIVKMQKKLKY